MASKSSFGANQVTVEIGDRLDTLGKQLDRLKVMYEQYFMGIQKIPPGQLHREVERTVRELTQLRIRNTAQRYKFSNLSSKFGSYNTYWKRIMRDIEAGRYVRDVRRASKRAAEAGVDMPPELLAKLPKRMRDRIKRDRDAIAERVEREKASAAGQAGAAGDELSDEQPAVIRSVKPKNVHHISEDDAALIGDDFDMDALFGGIIADDAPKAAAPKAAAPKAAPRAAPKPAPRPAPRAAPVPAPRAARPARASTPAGASPPPGMSEKQAKDLYQRYVQARKLVGESTDKVSYGKLMSSLNKQAPKIMKQHKAAGVEFNVVVKGDKVVLKAKPKR